ncbi:hypothetical protein ONZ45_g15481 [Pleurotus djamor]|nr:hypothetical protein ONZ45_g15481 [Pleurotus djamor]
MHCYFLTSASPSTPILYHVDELRTGRSYATRLVRAVQTGKTIFILLCSFQKPEIWQPTYQWSMPVVPPPEQCEPEEFRYHRIASQEGIDPKMKEYYLKIAFCILGYLSDFHFISTAPRILGLNRFGKGPKGLSMISSLDHSIYFYDNNFDCADWLLYVMLSPRIGSGRGVMHGRLYTRSGNLVAVTSQEGVVRADIRDPSIGEAKL